ncbi:MAG: TetR/AcrR family transcriptional regulator [Clostridia bacterium]|nr:TetR/AcrR family transcriptional regulator [Clostridia bacterium]
MKENQRTKLTKKLLKESLLNLLKEKDLDSITVTELCAGAQINRTTFYRYYKFPADVLTEMERELFTEMRDALKNVKTADEALDYLKTICRRCADKTDPLGFFLRYDIGAEHALILRDLYKSGSDFYNNVDSDEEHNKIIATYFAGGAFFYS